MATVTEYLKQYQPQLTQIDADRERTRKELGQPDSVTGFLQAIGQYAVRQRNEFDSSDPSIAARVIRGLNPITGVSDSIGSFYQNSQDNNYLGMGADLLTAMPFLPALRAIKTIDGLKTGVDGTKTIGRAGVNTITSYLADLVDSQ